MNKALSGETLHKNVSKLIHRRKEKNSKLVTSHTFSNKVKIDLNMLSASMEDQINSEVDGTKIITPRN